MVKLADPKCALLLNTNATATVFRVLGDHSALSLQSVCLARAGQQFAGQVCHNSGAGKLGV